MSSGSEITPSRWLNGEINESDKTAIVYSEVNIDQQRDLQCREHSVIESFSSMTVTGGLAPEEFAVKGLEGTITNDTDIEQSKSDHSYESHTSPKVLVPTANRLQNLQFTMPHQDQSAAKQELSKAMSSQPNEDLSFELSNRTLVHGFPNRYHSKLSQLETSTFVDGGQTKIEHGKEMVDYGPLFSHANLASAVGFGSSYDSSLSYGPARRSISPLVTFSDHASQSSKQSSISVSSDHTDVGSVRTIFTLRPSDTSMEQRSFAMNPFGSQPFCQLGSRTLHAPLFTRSVQAHLEPRNAQIEKGVVPDAPDHLSFFSARDYAVVKIGNISWDLTIYDVVRFFDDISIPVSSQPRVHILMDRATGKTLPNCYVELTHQDIGAALRKNKRVLNGRLVGVTLSSQEELLSQIFPKWQGSWMGLNAVTSQSISSIDTFKESSHLSKSSVPSSKPYFDLIFLTREEINQTLAVCKNYKLYYSRKCSQRPFENIISVLMKFPWHQRELLATLQRDHLFEMCKIAVQALSMHYAREHNIDSTLMNRLVKSFLMVPSFTEKQKLILLQAGGQKVPLEYRFLLSSPQCEQGEYNKLDNLNDHLVEPKVIRVNAGAYETPVANSNLYPSPPFEFEEQSLTTPTKLKGNNSTSYLVTNSCLNSSSVPHDNDNWFWSSPSGVGQQSTSFMQTRIKLLNESLYQANSTLQQQQEMVCRMERLISGSILRERQLKSRITKIEEYI